MVSGRLVPEAPANPTPPGPLPRASGPGCSPVWLRMCTRSVPLLANFWPQYGQVFSFSPVCVCTGQGVQRGELIRETAAMTQCKPFLPGRDLLLHETFTTATGLPAGSKPPPVGASSGI